MLRSAILRRALTAALLCVFVSASAALGADDDANFPPDKLEQLVAERFGEEE